MLISGLIAYIIPIKKYMLSISICNCHVHSDMHQPLFTNPNGLNHVFSHVIFIVAHKCPIRKLIVLQTALYADLYPFS